jgi:hypothetical protein
VDSTEGKTPRHRVTLAQATCLDYPIRLDYHRRVCHPSWALR